MPDVVRKKMSNDEAFEKICREEVAEGRLAPIGTKALRHRGTKGEAAAAPAIFSRRKKRGRPFKQAEVPMRAVRPGPRAAEASEASVMETPEGRRRIKDTENVLQTMLIDLQGNTPVPWKLCAKIAEAAMMCGKLLKRAS